MNKQSYFPLCTELRALEKIHLLQKDNLKDCIEKNSAQLEL